MIDTKKLRSFDEHMHRSSISDFNLLRECADHIDAQTAEIARLREALDGAATSLNTISTLAGSKDDYMEDMFQVRGYAHSRARVARAALSGESNG